MIKYEYEVASITFNQWNGKADVDYLDLINDYGRRGWRFVEFTPAGFSPKGAKGAELIFERTYED